MKFVKKPNLLYAAVLFAGLLTLPAAAQQEVSPDHFDDQPAVAQSKKAAASKSQAAVARQHRAANATSTQAKPKAAENSVLKADAGKGQPAPNSR